MADNVNDLLNLQKGNKLKISGEVWKVMNVNIYVWQDNENTLEYELRNQGQNIFLEIENTSDDLLIFMSREINASDLNVDFDAGSFYDEIIYKDEVYVYEEEDTAKYIPKTSGEEEENVRAVTFRNGQKFVTVEYWDDNSIEYYAGSSATKDVFSNIPSGKAANHTSTSGSNLPSFKNMATIGLVGAFILFAIFSGEDEDKPAYAVTTNPTNTIHQDLLPSDYSVILDDIDIEETEDFLKYKHKYVTIKISGDSILIDTLGWKLVSHSYFLAHENDLGMEIVSYHKGLMDAYAKPIGYNWAVGDSSTGSWQIANDSLQDMNEIWVPKKDSKYYGTWFSGKKYSLENFLDYTADYKGVKAFYGFKNGKYHFGTRSEEEKTYRSYYFKRVLRNLAWQTYYDQKNRNSSRYSNGSSTRGRSGGFGK